MYSVGVGDDITFDRSLIDRFGLCVHAFDPTPRSIAWVSAQNAVNQILVEFHHGHRGHTARQTRDAVRNLNAAGFRIFSISKKGYEYSFVKLSHIHVDDIARR